jgi:hypothetical protein
LKVKPSAKKPVAPKKAQKAKVEKAKKSVKVEKAVSGSKRLAEKRDAKGAVAEKRTRK